MYIDESDDIVNKYNNAYHRTIKMNPVDVKSNTYIDSSKENNIDDTKFEFGDIVRVWTNKNAFFFSQNVTLQIGLNKFLWLKKLKILCRGDMLIIMLMERKLLEYFTKKKCKKQKKQIKKCLEFKK